jgi:DNA-cytosine methyltransferase
MEDTQRDGWEPRRPECEGQQGGTTPFRAGSLPYVDLICGGFPCQDVSLAGARAGLDGKRSTLWSEFARLIREIRPRWILAENVGGLLSSDDGRFFGNILRDLAGAGYDAEWGVLSAADMGAPHLRKRVFIVAHARCEGWQCGRHGGRDTSDREVQHLWPTDGSASLPHANGRKQGRWQQLERVTDRRDADLAGHGAEGELADAEGNGRQPRGTGDTAQGQRGWKSDRGGERRNLSDADGRLWAELAQSEQCATSGSDWWAVEPAIC